MVFKRWRRLFYVCIFLASIHALAEERPTVSVWTKGSVDSAKALFGNDPNVVILDREEEERAEKKAGHIPPHARDSIFRKVGIETKISSMDEFDKDILMISAREYTVRELKSEYPMLSEEQLAVLKREVENFK